MMTKMIATVAFIFSVVVSPLASADSFGKQILTRADVIQAIESVDSEVFEVVTDLSKQEISEKSSQHF